MGAERELLDPSGMEAHLVPMADLDREVVFPCGEWVLPEAGEYRFWLEGAGWISTSHGILGYSAPPFAGRGSVTVRTVVPSGRVALEPATALGASDELRLLHLESHNRLDSPQPEMSRRFRGELPAEGLAMPAGPVLAAVYDRDRGEYEWVSRPIDLAVGSTAAVAQRIPRVGSDVVVILDRPKAAVAFEEYDVTPSLSLADGALRQPDVLIPTAERLYAVWYEVEGRLATLAVDSASTFLPEQEIPLRAGRVESFRGVLRPLPGLTVRLDLPPELSMGEEPFVELSTFPERVHLQRHALSAAEDRVVFDGVPARRVEVAVDLPPWRFMERVDLGDGLDREVWVRPRPVEVSGTVHRGDRPHPAEVTFSLWTGDERYLHRVETDDEGRYRTWLYRPSTVAWVELRGVDTRPWVEMLSASFEQDTVLDFVVPGNDWTVQVTDTETGEPLAGAEVRYVSVQGVPPKDLGRQSGRVTTDGEGSAALPPLAPGEVWLTAFADGYRTPDLLKLAVEESDPGRQVEIALQPDEPESSGRLVIKLPDGRPAAGAELVAVPRLGADAEPAWSGSADALGAVELPDRLLDHVLVVRHPEVAFLARPWSGASSVAGETWSLPAVAAPLTVRLRRSWGDPAPWARVAVEVGDALLSGGMLRWAAGSSSADDTGTWRATGLPAGQPVAVVAWMPAEDVPRDPVALLASFATRIPYPWTGTVELEAVE